jgi:hypothetical protein
MGKLVLFIASVLQCNEDAQVMCSWHHAHTRASELGAQLIVPPSHNTFLRAVDVEGGNGRVVRSLLGDVGDGDELVVAR